MQGWAIVHSYSKSGPDNTSACSSGDDDCRANMIYKSKGEETSGMVLREHTGTIQTLHAGETGLPLLCQPDWVDSNAHWLGFVLQKRAVLSEGLEGRCSRST